MKLLGLLLILAAASCDSEPRNINRWMDGVLSRTNVVVRRGGGAVLSIPAGRLNHKISYSDGLVLGLDSFYRTEDSTYMFNGTHSIFDIHYGFKFLTAAFKNVSVEGVDMDASLRIRDNSIHFVFDLIRIYGCRVHLMKLEVEKLAKVELGSSREELDGSDVEEIFEKEVLQAFNAYLDANKEYIERSLQFLCSAHEVNKYPEPPYLEFVEQFFNSHIQSFKI